MFRSYEECLKEEKHELEQDESYKEITASIHDVLLFRSYVECLKEEKHELEQDESYKEITAFLDKQVNHFK